MDVSSSTSMEIASASSSDDQIITFHPKVITWYRLSLDSQVFQCVSKVQIGVPFVDDLDQKYGLVRSLETNSEEQRNKYIDASKTEDVFLQCISKRKFSNRRMKDPIAALYLLSQRNGFWLPNLPNYIDFGKATRNGLRYEFFTMNIAVNDLRLTDYLDLTHERKLPFDSKTAFAVFYQLCIALMFLHRNGFAHTRFMLADIVIRVCRNSKTPEIILNGGFNSDRRNISAFVTTMSIGGGFLNGFVDVDAVIENETLPVTCRNGLGYIPLEMILDQAINITARDYDIWRAFVLYYTLLIKRVPYTIYKIEAEDLASHSLDHLTNVKKRLHFDDSEGVFLGCDGFDSSVEYLNQPEETKDFLRMVLHQPGVNTRPRTIAQIISTPYVRARILELTEIYDFDAKKYIPNSPQGQVNFPPLYKFPQNWQDDKTASSTGSITETWQRYLWNCSKVNDDDDENETHPDVTRVRYAAASRKRAMK